MCTDICPWTLIYLFRDTNCLLRCEQPSERVMVNKRTDNVQGQISGYIFGVYIILQHTFANCAGKVFVNNLIFAGLSSISVFSGPTWATTKKYVSSFVKVSICSFIFNLSSNEGFYHIDHKDLTDWGISVGLYILGYFPLLARAYLITWWI